MDFSDLKDDTAIQTKLINFNKSVNDLDKILEIAFNGIKYEALAIKDKMNFDLFIAYTLNTLYWLYLRSKGMDPNENDVKKELGRIRDYMLKSKDATERHTLRPNLNVPVAERFIKHGISHPNKDNANDMEDDGPPIKEVNNSKKKSSHQRDGASPRKRRRN